VKAVILAAGQGTRIRPLTKWVPKPMIPVITKPVMEFMVDLLRQHGFTDIVISVGYLAKDIEHYFRDGARFGVNIAYSFEGYYDDGRVVPEGLGAAGGLKKIQAETGFFDDTFAVVCGDVIVDVDLTRVLAFHRRKKADATMVLKDLPRKDVGRYGVVDVAAGGKILRFEEKPAPEVATSTTVNTGLYLFEPTVLDCIPPGRPCDIALEFFPTLLERGMRFFGIALPFTWLDVGNIPDYWQATQLLLSGQIDLVDMPGRQIAPGIWAGINTSLDLDAVRIEGPVCIGSGTRIEAGATIIGPSVIGRNSVIERGAHITASLVGDYTRISGFVHLNEHIVNGRYCVNRQGEAIELAGGGYAFAVDDARERRQWTDDQQALIDFLHEQAS
jgi:mannose-1-phosphate guanylyltransferase